MDDLLRLATGSAGGVPPKPVDPGHASSHLAGQEVADRYLAIKQELDIIRQQTSAISTSLNTGRTRQESLDVQVHRYGGQE
jgi:hypothetical protein